MSTPAPTRARLTAPRPRGAPPGLLVAFAALAACGSDSGGGEPARAEASARDAVPADAAASDAAPADVGPDGPLSPDVAGPPEPASVSPTPIDRAVLRRFPAELQALAAAGLPSDAGGLIGRNRRWGAMYAARFQLGAGNALRISLAAERPREVSLAFAAIRAGLSEVGEDGYLPERLPESEFPGAVLSPADVASGGAFFLGDACLGLLALQASPDADTLVPPGERADIVSRAVRATGWLATQADLLQAADAAAPNRLFFDAVTFQACGALGATPAFTSLGEDFAARAYALFEPAGYFIEGGGHDTSYQAVAISQAVNFHLAGGADPGGARAQTLRTAAHWLAARIDAEGRLDSSGNTRTCGGGESFLGEAKLVSLPTVFSALAYVGVPPDDGALVDAAERVSTWVQSHPDTDPCWPAATP